MHQYLQVTPIEKVMKLDKLALDRLYDDLYYIIEEFEDPRVETSMSYLLFLYLLIAHRRGHGTPVYKCHINGTCEWQYPVDFIHDLAVAADMMAKGNASVKAFREIDEFLNTLDSDVILRFISNRATK